MNRFNQEQLHKCESCAFPMKSPVLCQVDGLPPPPVGLAFGSSGLTVGCDDTSKPFPIDIQN